MVDFMNVLVEKWVMKDSMESTETQILNIDTE
jgi:hypothetical protein